MNRRQILGAALLGAVLLGSGVAVPGSAFELPFEVEIYGYEDSSTSDAQVTDIEHDAYRWPMNPQPPVEKPPVEALSAEPADIRSTTLRLSPNSTGGRRSYSVSIWLTGNPEPPYNYVAMAEFGDRCYLSHPLSTRRSAPAIAYCPSDDGQYEIVGWLEAARLNSGPNSIGATYSYDESQLPAELKAAPVLEGITVMTCATRDRSGACYVEDILDYARGNDSKFSIR